MQYFQYDVNCQSFFDYWVSFDKDIQNNNEELKEENKGPFQYQKNVALNSPVLSVVNLPKIFVTNIINEKEEESTDVTAETWSPEIPFENLTASAEVTEIEIEKMIGVNSLGQR